jgi:hypothetical protein
VKIFEAEKQLILYTKNHFKRNRSDEDLKYFAAKLYGLDPRQTEKYNVINMVVDLYEKLIAMGLIKFTLNSFLSETFRRAWRQNGNDNVNWDTVISHILAEIQGMQVKDKEKVFIELGEADLSILPELTVTE